MARGKVMCRLQEFRVVLLQILDALPCEGLGALPVDLPHDQISRCRCDARQQIRQRSADVRPTTARP